MASRFSRRHGYSGDSNEIKVREDAPESLRVGLLNIVHDQLKLRPRTIRDIVCGVLRCRPDPSNWSEYPNVWGEVEHLVYDSEWYRIYDCIEAFYSHFATEQYSKRADEYEALINGVFIEEGIGWQLTGGEIEARGDDAFEAAVEDAIEGLGEYGFAVATSELAEARKDMSRRPEADLSGAVHHALAALEAVARETAGSSKATLGDMIKRNPSLFPKPVDDAVSKLWGFASENARHGKETRKLEWEETQLIVGVSAVLVSYLLGKSEGLS